MQRRDGFEGWNRRYEAAYDRIFHGEPSPHDIAHPADMIRAAVDDELLRRRSDTVRPSTTGR